MSSSPSNVVRLFPQAAPLTVADEELSLLKALLATAKQDYLEASAAFDTCNVGLGQHDPELRSHPILSQIDSLEAGIAALSDAVKTFRAEV